MMEKPEGYTYSIPMGQWPQEWKDYRWYCRTLRNHPEWEGQSFDELKESMAEHKKQLHLDGVKRMTEAMANKTEEERKAINKRKRAKIWDSDSPEEIEAHKQHMQSISQQFWDKMTEEERAEFVKSREDGLSEEQKEQRAKRGREHIQTYVDSLTMEEKQENGRRMAAAWKVKYDSSPEFREQHLAQLADARKTWMSQLTPEKRAEIGERTSSRWENLPEEEKQKYSERTTQRNYEWWASRTEEDRKRISERMKAFNEELWNNMPMEQFVEMHRRRLASAPNYDKNKLTKSVESMFNHSIASRDFYLVPEVPYVIEREVHFWDYGIYRKSDDQLVMVVDVDGAYNHADKCDYNGLHSREESDEKRFYLSPPNVKIAIIYESRLTNSFDKLLRELMMNYDEFVESQFKYCRSINFPYPRYSTDELLESWKSLVKMNCNDEYHQNMSLNTRVGDRLINHFHPSIYHAHRGNNPSPYDAWYDDLLLKKVIENRMIYVNELNPNKILQGFNVCKLAPKVSVFSAAKAKMLVNKYLSDATEIFDPFSGFSGRMLGTVALGKKYTGIDLSDTHVRESEEIVHFLKAHEVHIDATLLEWDVMKASGSYDALFTCPPYETKEVWEKSNGEQLTCDEWIDVCLKRFDCKKYLFVVDKTEKYKDHIVDEIVNKSHLGTNTEYVVLIERP